MSFGRPWQYAGLVVVAMLAVAAAGWQLSRPSAPQQGRAVNLAGPTATGSAATTTPQLPFLRPVPRGAEVLAVGDSWGAGTGADTPTDGFLYLTARHFGWRLEVLPNGGGTGFLNPGPRNAGTYATRLAHQPADPAVSLVIVQGGLNDISETPRKMSRAVGDTLTVAAAKYPKAQVLVVGFAVRGSYPAVDALDQAIDDQATRHHDPWIDPDEEGWRPQRHLHGPAANHPTTAGHRELARLLEADIRDLVAAAPSG